MDIQKFKRGQVWWLLDNTPYIESIQGGNRPVIIISNDLANRFSKNVTIIPCTTADKKDIPTHCPLYITQNSTALTECITTVPTSKLTSYIGTLDSEVMNKIDSTIKIALGLVTEIKPSQTQTPIQVELTQSKQDSITIKPVGRKGFDRDFKIRYLNDYKNHDIEFMMKKYKLNSRKTAWQRAKIWSAQLEDE